MNGRRNFFFIIFLFILVNLVFNCRIFKEIFDFNSQKVFTNDGAITEFLTETTYQNLLNFKNPFITNKIFYPFEINFSLSDPSSSNVLPFLFLRKFFDSYHSLLIIVILNLFLGNIFMYWLLRKLKINQYIALLGGMIFGFMPFISHRIVGHYTYTTIYVFPLSFLTFYNLIDTEKIKKKIVLGLFFGVILSFTLLTNFYYFLTIVLGGVFYLLVYYFQNKKLLITVLKKNIEYFLLSILIFLIILAPWLIEVYRIFYFAELVKNPRFAGVVDLSADLLSFFLPSEFNPVYKNLFLKIQGVNPFLTKSSRFFFSSWERFAYPGIIILTIYFFVIFLRKKLPLKLWNKIKPHFLISIFFIVLSMGPFLKIANRWALPLENGVNLVFPLPFLMLLYFPGFESIRAPMRFNPGLVFLATIVTAFVLNYYYTKLSKKGRILFILIIFLVFLVDQFYVIPPKLPSEVPFLAYQYIKNDKENSTVLEIPFVVRDGFNYLGFVHAITTMKGALIHGKPTIGGYEARIDLNILNYYKNLPFIGYLSQIIDKGNYNPYKEKTKEPNIFPFDGDIDLARKEIDFLDIKYIVLKSGEKYTQAVREVIVAVGFSEVLNDNKYDLYERKPTKTNFEKVEFGNKDDFLFTAANFSFREDGFRWAQGKLAKVFVKTNDVYKQKLIFEGLSFYQPQKIKVYLNKKYLGEKEITTNKEKYVFSNIKGKLKSGINTIYFKFTKSFTPAKLWTHDKDTRDLAVKFFTVEVE